MLQTTEHSNTHGKTARFELVDWGLKQCLRIISIVAAVRFHCNVDARWRLLKRVVYIKLIAHLLSLYSAEEFQI